jgi:mevalonate kinase
VIGRGSAPGKVILSGEHFVVHGAPAIALPARSVRKEVEIDERLDPYDHALELSIVDPFPEHRNLQQMLVTLLEKMQIPAAGEVRIAVRSTVAPGAHLGSSAALAVALVRAVADLRHLELADDVVADLAFELEKIVHKNPSGIDNTVIALDRPIWFRRGAPAEPIECAVDATLLVADTGRLSSTAEVVAGVAAFRGVDEGRWARLISAAEETTTRLRAALAAGDASAAGACMNRNQELLATIGASSTELEALVAAAIGSGAFGAKLTGAGGGGNAIALWPRDLAEPIRLALLSAGAASVLEVPLDARGA